MALLNYTAKIKKGTSRVPFFIFYQMLLLLRRLRHILRQPFHKSALPLVLRNLLQWFVAMNLVEVILLPDREQVKDEVVQI